MSSYSLSHLTDAALLRNLSALVSRDRSTTAALLAHLAEVDGRKPYLPAAYPSMFAYCVGKLRFSEETAYKRIQAARAARCFPAIFDAVADGRLHLTAVVLLKPHLTPETADELLGGAAHKSKSEIELLLAHKFPRPDVRTWVAAIPLASPVSGTMRLDPDPVRSSVGNTPEVDPDPVPASSDALVTGSEALQSTRARAKIVPLAPGRFALQVTIAQSTRDKLRPVEELLSHQIPPGDVAELLDRALDALIAQLEKRKFAATSKPRPARRRASTNERYIPAHVRRAVKERDGGQCTFVSAAGQRGAARKFIEFDHIDEVARGGRATVEGIRLRSRAHNQFGAECTFGKAFMENKRQESRRAAEAKRAAEAERAAEAQRAQASAAAAQKVIPWLRALGFRADQPRHAAGLCESIPDAPLEERVRVALSALAPSRGVCRIANQVGTAA